MTHAHEASSEKLPDTPPDSSQKLADLLKNKYEIELPTKAVRLIGDSLSFIDRIYSDPEKPTHYEYHNVDHSYGVAARTAWLLNFFKTKLKRNIDTKDFELATIMAVTHDAVLAKFRGSKDTLEFNFNDYAISLSNDSDKSDEELSAELALAMMRQYGYDADTTQLEDQKRVYTGIRATEYTRIGKDVSLKHVAKNFRDPAIIAVIIADTDSIFAHGDNAIPQDVSNLSAEVIGDDIDDVGKVTEVVTGFMSMQTKFLMARSAEYSILARGLGKSDGDSSQLMEKMEHYLRPYHDNAISAAAHIDKHIDDFRRYFYDEYTKCRNIGFAAAKAYAQLFPGD